MKMTWNINFSRCDGFTVLSISIKYCSIKFIVSPLQPWQMTLKSYQKKNYLNEGWLFIGRFKVGSLPRMIKKEVLGHVIYKPS